MRSLILAGIVVTTAACTNQKTDLNPGQWEVTSDLFHVTEATPRKVGSLQAQHCLGNSERPDADFLTGSRFSGDCAYRQLTFEDGQIRGKARCMQAGMTVQQTVEGKYSATNFEVTRRGEFTKGEDRLVFESRSRGRRLGDCRAASDSGDRAALLRPGKWAMTTTVGKIDLPDARPEFADVGNTTGEPTTFEFCMSSQMAANPQGPIFAGVKDASCTYERFQMKGGNVDAKANCGAQSIVMTGEYGRERYALRQVIEQDGGPYVGRMKANVTIDARRIGDC